MSYLLYKKMTDFLEYQNSNTNTQVPKINKKSRLIAEGKLRSLASRGAARLVRGSVLSIVCVCVNIKKLTLIIKNRYVTMMMWTSTLLPLRIIEEMYVMLECFFFSHVITRISITTNTQKTPDTSRGSLGKESEGVREAQKTSIGNDGKKD